MISNPTTPGKPPPPPISAPYKSSQPLIRFLRDGGPLPWWRLGCLLALTLALPVLWFFDPEATPILPSGLLTSFTSFECPACGMTRATHSLLHGQWARALDFNPLAPLILSTFLALLFFPKLLLSNRLLILITVIATAFTLWRNF